MQIFIRFIGLIARLPDWVSLLLCPILFLTCSLVFAFTKKRQWLNYTAFAFGAAGCFLVCCEGGAGVAFIWSGLYTLLFLAVKVTYFFTRKKGKKQSKEDAMYEKFHLPLNEPTVMEEGGKIPKVNCYFEEETPLRDAEESGLRLEHVLELLKKLQTMKLSPSDRLETDVVSRRVNGLRYKKLTEEELSVLNDCLATTLRLTAKYAV